MDSNVLWAAMALVLVLEGLLPFISPGGWRRTFEKLLTLQDGQLRFFGLCSMLIGLAMLWFLS
ncbi:MAG: DUF2065 domain-containing protein [Burkholderiales bacterium]|nr:DUF2065 domain-containing protein [Burkholderiales bacterium]